jgi:hypothetical protein
MEDECPAEENGNGIKSIRISAKNADALIATKRNFAS